MMTVNIYFLVDLEKKKERGKNIHFFPYLDEVKSNGKTNEDSEQMKMKLL